MKRKEHLKRMVRLHTRKADDAYRRFVDSPTSTNFNDLAMEAFQATNYAISLMERIVEEKRLGIAMSYAELVEHLEKASLVNASLSKKLKRLIRLRNLITHEYYTINNNELIEMYKLLSSLRALLR